MSAKHTVRITNPEGDSRFTKIEVDGVQQYIRQFDVGHQVDGSVEVRLVYPYCAVEVELTNVEVKRQHSVRLFIPGYEGVTAHGYGGTIADALRDMASRLDAEQP